MKRISNSATLWMHIGWPIAALSLLAYVISEVVREAPSAPQLIVLVGAMLLWRRVFAKDPYEVIEGNGQLIVRRGREAIRIPYSGVSAIAVRGGRLKVETIDPRLKEFTFLPMNTSYLSTGASRREALEIFARELTTRIKSS